MDYGKEALKVQYGDELKEVYRELLEDEERELDKINEQWRFLKQDFLKAIAQYDVATSGGVNKDLNTLNVEIITKIERFKVCDTDPKRMQKVKDLESNINALKRLIG